MISTCPGIDKYAFYLDFKGVLSSKPQASVIVSCVYLLKNYKRIINELLIA
jgi:hypothetical protein